MKEYLPAWILFCFVFFPQDDSAKVETLRLNFLGCFHEGSNRPNYSRGQPIFVFQIGPFIFNSESKRAC
jgi:hypothetical protein